MPTRSKKVALQVHQKIVLCKHVKSMLLTAMRKSLLCDLILKVTTLSLAKRKIPLLKRIIGLTKTKVNLTLPSIMKFTKIK